MKYYNKEYLEGWLTAYCDTIESMVQSELLPEEDIAVKAIDKIRKYIKTKEIHYTTDWEWEPFQKSGTDNVKGYTTVIGDIL